MGKIIPDHTYSTLFDISHCPENGNTYATFYSFDKESYLAGKQPKPSKLKIYIYKGGKYTG